MNDKVQEIRKALEGTQWGTEEQRLPHRCEIAQNGAEWLSYLLTEIDEEREARKELENHYAGLEYANVDNVLELEQLRPEIESLQQQLDAAKKENERLQVEVNNISEDWISMEQQLKQAIEALEEMFTVCASAAVTIRDTPNQSQDMIKLLFDAIDSNEWIIEKETGESHGI
jgi:chromosome segregation ATPase